ncbi:oxidoreductase [Salmonirosea aquatica]|uniref:NAD(P)H-binding protein n=1 Tax=Salmonirosea aquatica TaxID=2654236 RepID=A0A7C9FEK0_9BACT|nr:NAD(P)H-binding protein [Cytophagaceae bacterium SJW1-29]
MASGTPSKTALVIGATGLIGKQLVGELLNSDRYQEVRVLVRKSLRIPNPKLVEVLYNFAQPDASQVVSDDVYCCLGTTMKQAGSKEAFYAVDYEYPLQTARFARQNGAAQYLIVSSMGANPKSIFFYNRVKGEVEQSLRAVGFASLHIFRPSLLLGNRGEQRTGEKIGETVMRLFNPVMVGSLKKYRAIDSAKVAKAMLAFASQEQSGVFVHESDELQAY